MSQARKISQTFNGLNQWIVSGTYFKLLSTVNAVDVQLYYRGQLVGDASQVSAGFYAKTEFDRITVTTGANELVSFIFAGDESGSDQFTGNVVVTSVPIPLNVVAYDNFDAQAVAGTMLVTASRQQGWNGATWDLLRADNEGAGAGALRVTRFGDAITRASAAFIGTVSQAAGGAGTFCQAQIWNPAGSGILVYLDRVKYTAAAAGYFDLRYNAAAIGAVAATLGNKNITGVAPAGQLRGLVAAATAGTQIHLQRQPGSTVAIIEFNPPLRIPAGAGVIVNDQTANDPADANFEWRELAI